VTATVDTRSRTRTPNTGSRSAGSRSAGSPRRADALDEVRSSSTSGGLAAAAAAARSRRALDDAGQVPPSRRAPRPAPSASQRRAPDSTTSSTGRSARAGRAARGAGEARGAVGRVPGDLGARSAPRGGRGALAAAVAVAAPEIPAGEVSALRLVEPRRRAKAPARPGVVLGGLSLLAVVSVFALVTLHVVSAEKQLQLDRLTQREQQAQSTYEDLRLEVNTLDTPQRIMASASKLGMVQPGSVTFIRVPDAPSVSGLSSPGGVPSGPADSTKMEAVLAGNA
jgi:cell division protein FtsL